MLLYNAACCGIYNVIHNTVCFLVDNSTQQSLYTIAIALRPLQKMTTNSVNSQIENCYQKLVQILLHIVMQRNTQLMLKTSEPWVTFPEHLKRTQTNTALHYKRMNTLHSLQRSRLIISKSVRSRDLHKLYKTTKRPKSDAVFFRSAVLFCFSITIQLYFDQRNVLRSCWTTTPQATFDFAVNHILLLALQFVPSYGIKTTETTITV